MSFGRVTVTWPLNISIAPCCQHQHGCGQVWYTRNPFDWQFFLSAIHCNWEENNFPWQKFLCWWYMHSIKKKTKVLSLFVSLRKMQILLLCYKRPGMPALDASGKCVWSVRNVLSRAGKHCLGRSPHKRAPGMIKQKNSICDMICTVKSHSSCSQGSRKIQQQFSN